MKIAHLVPSSIVFPLAKPNGRYTWVLALARLQARAGHDVSIFASPGSSDNSSIRWRSLSAVTDDRAANNEALIKFALSNDSYDIFHSHFDNLHYRFGPLTHSPIIYTQHWWPHRQTVDAAQHYTGNNIWAVPPTRHMYNYDTRHGIASRGSIYHGIDLELFRPQAVPKNGRLLFVGRISPEKRLELCLEVAQQSGIGLDIIGKITEKNELYWQQLQSSVDDSTVRYLGTKNHKELAGYYSAAQAVIFPADTHEAFGLVAIESQACGTPIIMARGASREELLDIGTTGFLCDTADEYIAAARDCTQLQASNCRDFAHQFDVRTMADAYEALYRDVLSEAS